MKRFISVFLFIAVSLQIFFSSSCQLPQGKEKFNVYYFDFFDTVTSVVGYAESQEEFNVICNGIKEDLSEYHKLYDIYTSYDGLNNICTINKTEKGAHKVVKVDKAVIELLEFSKEMYTLTDGRVNVAMGSVLSIWHQYRNEGISDPEKAQLPPMKLLKEAAKHTDINDVIIDKEASTVYLKDPEMTLDVGAIAKGYAVERVAEKLESEGVTSFVLNVGGNVCTIGMGGKEPWQVGVENPFKDTDVPYTEYLKLSGESLVTSGVYQRFYEVDGKSFHHIIDGETLMPGDKYSSVSVLCDDSGLADALSTALFLMDYKKGIALVNSIDGVEAMWVENNGKKIYSEGFEAYTFDYNGTKRWFPWVKK